MKCRLTCNCCSQKRVQSPKRESKQGAGVYVTTPNEKLMVKPSGFTNTAAATGTYTIIAVKDDPREIGLQSFAPMR